MWRIGKQMTTTLCYVICIRMHQYAGGSFLDPQPISVWNGTIISLISLPIKGRNATIKFYPFCHYTDSFDY